MEEEVEEGERWVEEKEKVEKGKGEGVFVWEEDHKVVKRNWRKIGDEEMDEELQRQRDGEGRR